LDGRSSLHDLGLQFITSSIVSLEFCQYLLIFNIGTVPLLQKSLH
jgi:hypothetical protein